MAVQNPGSRLAPCRPGVGSARICPARYPFLATGWQCGNGKGGE